MLLVVAVVALTLIGFVMIYSASQVTILSEAATNYYADTEAGQYLRDTISYSDYIAQQNPSAKLISQFVYSLAGILIAVAIWFMLPRSGWKGAIVKGYWGVCVALLVITFLFGTAALGAQRWIVIGPFALQPSEFAKIAIVLMAANLMDDLNEGAGFNATMIRAAIYVVAPTLFLLLTQSDLGTTIIIFVGVYAVLWFGGAPAKLMLAIAGAAVVAIVAIVLFGSGYRQDRFVVYNPWNDGEGGRGNGYQTIHSFYAFAEGGLLGVGLGNSSGEVPDYLPESETDFVFSIIGEEFGHARRPCGHRAVRAASCSPACASPAPQPTPNERIVRGQRNHHARVPGVSEHGLRHRPRAHHGQAPAVRVRRRLVADRVAHDGRHHPGGFPKRRCHHRLRSTSREPARRACGRRRRPRLSRRPARPRQGRFAHARAARRASPSNAFFIPEVTSCA